LFEAGEQVLEFFRRVSGIGGGREQWTGDHGAGILPGGRPKSQPSGILLASVRKWRHDSLSLS
jgi:hypothetical protein